MGAGVEAGGGGGGGASGGGGGDDDDHAEFMRELASQNGLQLGCSHGQDERARHRREVERRIEVQSDRGTTVRQRYGRIEVQYSTAFAVASFVRERRTKDQNCSEERWRPAAAAAVF